MHSQAVLSIKDHHRRHSRKTQTIEVLDETPSEINGINIQHSENSFQVALDVIS